MQRDENSPLAKKGNWCALVNELSSYHHGYWFISHASHITHCAVTIGIEYYASWISFQYPFWFWFFLDFTSLSGLLHRFMPPLRCTFMYRWVNINYNFLGVFLSLHFYLRIYSDLTLEFCGVVNSAVVFFRLLMYTKEGECVGRILSILLNFSCHISFLWTERWKLNFVLCFRLCKIMQCFFFCCY